MTQNRNQPLIKTFGSSTFPLKTTVSIFALAALIIVSGCESVNKKEQETMQMQIAGIYRNTKAQADVAANLNQLHDDITSLTGQIEEINARSEMQSGRLSNLERGASTRRIYENIRSSNIRLEKISEILQSLSVNVLAFINLMEKKNGISKSRHKRAVQRVLDSGAINEILIAEKSQNDSGRPEASARNLKYPEDFYRIAYSLFLQGEYDKAIAGFNSYLREYSQTALSDNAAYWIGEAEYGKGDYQAAFQAFDSMVENYPESNKAPSALLKSADAMNKLENSGEAVKRLNLIVERYPTSNEAIIATERLETELGGADAAGESQ